MEEGLDLWEADVGVVEPETCWGKINVNIEKYRN
jgi:hypothetical protein